MSVSRWHSSLWVATMPLHPHAYNRGELMKATHCLPPHKPLSPFYVFSGNYVYCQTRLKGRTYSGMAYIAVLAAVYKGGETENSSQHPTSPTSCSIATDRRELSLSASHLYNSPKCELCRLNEPSPAQRAGGSFLGQTIPPLSVAPAHQRRHELGNGKRSHRPSLLNDSR
ncbi:hypothetical protein K474DRAFT_705481 [Panus rudis PR-1116 ss-1]|nr:hypothetical protein K474DRAFT_705481 [Panus rudis PR-1116 ss-1]